MTVPTWRGAMIGKADNRASLHDAQINNFASFQKRLFSAAFRYAHF